MSWNENAITGLWRRALQAIARGCPGAMTLRPMLHRWRGVKIGRNVWIGYDAIIETSKPHLVTLKDGSAVGQRAQIIAHMREMRGVTIEEDALVGAGSIVLPGVTVGRGTVVAAGSVVTSSLPPMVFAQGNPAKPIAKITVPLKMDVSMKQFSLGLKPIARPGPRQSP